MIVDFPSGIDYVAPVKTYSPVGTCIYCGHKNVPLFPEHIIPFGIAGDAFVLPKASCKKCGDMTGQFENKILRNSWWPFRAHIGAPTYKPKERPDKYNLRKVRHENNGFVVTEESQVAVDDFPRHISMLRLHPPGILENRPAVAVIEGELWNGYASDDVQRYANKDQHGVYLGRIHTGAFCRMLAKIGHSYATAELGYGNFQPLLKKLIKGKSLTPTYWVGGDWEIPLPMSGVLHSIGHRFALIGTKRYVVVGVRLFPFFNTPQFHIVAGDCS